MPRVFMWHNCCCRKKLTECNSRKAQKEKKRRDSEKNFNRLLEFQQDASNSYKISGGIIWQMSMILFLFHCGLRCEWFSIVNSTNNKVQKLFHTFHRQHHRRHRYKILDLEFCQEVFSVSMFWALRRDAIKDWAGRGGSQSKDMNLI